MADKPKDKEGFKISELEHIKNIDNNDLLLVSDKEGGKYYTKSMTVEQLVQKVIAQVAASQQITDQIREFASEAAAAAVEEAVDEVYVPQKVLDVIEQNSAQVFDMIDGQRNGVIEINGNN